jgi:hypothetical protein
MTWFKWLLAKHGHGSEFAMLLLLAAGGASDALAQMPIAGRVPAEARLEGEVVDSVTGRPIEGVLIRMDSGPETLSDANGRFVIEALTPGQHMLALLTSDCRIKWGAVFLTPGGRHTASFELAPPIGTEIQVRREAQERRRSFGRLITREQIEKLSARTLADVLRRYVPRMVGSATGDTGFTDVITQRAPNSLTGLLEPIVVVDGIRMHDAAETIAVIKPGEVEELEILTSSSGGWEYGSAGSAGVIKITTRKGIQDLPPRSVEPCMVPGFPRPRG